MRSYTAALLIAAIVAAALTPAVKPLALRLGALSHPGGRHIHDRSIPRLGGLAMYVAVLAPLVGLFFVEAAVARNFTADLRKVGGLFAGATLMVGVGAYDDARGMRAVFKLAAQAAVGVLAYACGFRIDAVELPLFGSISLGMLGLPVTLIWIVGIVNAVNLIDGLDGLAGGVVFFAAFTNFIVALLTGAQLAALFSAAMMGSVLGFLFHNFNPARVFMGDSGSYFLGFMLALTSLSGVPRASSAVALLVPILAMGVPIFDVLFSMVRRYLERRPIFSADRGHIHHRLLDAGITHRRAVLILYAVCAALAGSAIAAHLGRAWQIGVALLVASTALIVLVRLAGLFGHLGPRARRRVGAASRESRLERLRREVPVFLAASHDAYGLELLAPHVEHLAEEAMLDRIAIVDLESMASIWFAERTSLQPNAPKVELVLPLGERSAATHGIQVGWRGHDGQEDPQVEVLLQLVADRIAERLDLSRATQALPRSDINDAAASRSDRLPTPSRSRA